MERIKDAAARGPAAGIGIATELLEITGAAGIVGDPFRVRRENAAGAGGFEDLRGAGKSHAHMFAVETRKGIAHNRLALGVELNRTAVTIAQEDADSHQTRKCGEEFAVLHGIAPGQKC